MAVKKPKIVVSQDVYDTLCRMIDARDGDPVAELLLDELERAKRVKAGKLPSDVVTVNSVVTFIVQKTSKHYTYQLVYPQHAGGNSQALSVFSPAGRCAFGPKPGAKYRLAGKARPVERDRGDGG